MIQRIQTVYFLIAEVLIGTLYYLPFAEVTDKEGKIYQLDFTGFLPEIGNNTNWMKSPLFLLGAVCFLLILVTIFQYKQRMLQISLSSIAAFLLVGMSGLIFYYGKSAEKMVAGTGSLNLVALSPVIAAIIIYLAIRAINKDEKLVRSIDRIR
jgi:hypothetical protein